MPMTDNKRLQNVVHLAYCSISTGGPFLGAKTGGVWSYKLPSPTSNINDIYPTPLYAFMW